MLYDTEENFAHFAQESFIIKRNLRRHCSGKSKATQAKARTSTLVSSIISATAEQNLTYPSVCDAFEIEHRTADRGRDVERSTDLTVNNPQIEVLCTYGWSKRPSKDLS